MELLLALSAFIIIILSLIVLFLSFKLFQYRRLCSRYEILDQSQVINNWHKYVGQQTRKPLNRETDSKTDAMKASNRLIHIYNQIPCLISSSDSQKDLSSAPEAKNKQSIDDIEISEFEMTNNELPAIDFKLVYLTQTSTLRMHIRRVSNLPLQLRKNCSSYVKLSLITDSEKLSSYHTNIIKKSLNPKYEEDFTFSSVSFEDLRNLTIRICVYVKRKQLSKRQLVGDLWVPLSRPDLEPDVELVCCEKLSLACPQTGKRGPLLMVGKLGFLFVQIQYQTSAKRIKLVIRKAQNLYNKSITNNFQITKPEFGMYCKGWDVFESVASLTAGLQLPYFPEYYVIVNLLQNSETVIFKETKASVGVSPVWNQPFLFDVNETDISHYWIQCLVMQGKTYTKDGVIGQVLIGPNTTVSGIQHWNDVLESESQEISKWHPLTGVGTACL